MKIYIDEDLPESCASCQFLVHCDQCEGSENYCPFVGAVGYDPSDNLIDGAPITPSSERHEECPLVQMPHVTDEQISDAFQVAIASYWEEKSKYLTPPPVPCCVDTRKKKGEKNE